MGGWKALVVKKISRFRKTSKIFAKECKFAENAKNVRFSWNQRVFGGFDAELSLGTSYVVADV